MWLFFAEGSFMNNRKESHKRLAPEELRDLLAALPDNEIHVIPFADDREGDEMDAV